RQRHISVRTRQRRSRRRFIAVASRWRTDVGDCRLVQGRKTLRSSGVAPTDGRNRVSRLGFRNSREGRRRWLRSDSEQRRNFFTPAKLRQAADGKFRGKDYGYHCELGGHPVPTSWILLRRDEVTSQLLLSDLLGHTGRIWDHLLRWSEGNDWAMPLQFRK